MAKSNLPNEDSKLRFSNKVDDYQKFRPNYPPQLVELLCQKIGISPEWTIADIGCGTGISSEPFLKAGLKVIGIEPNEPMRLQAMKNLKDFQQFTAVAGSAEATTLADQSIDLLMAAQASHWFDPIPARQEFLRILKPHGRIVIFDNYRLEEASPSALAYEEILRTYGQNYSQAKHRKRNSNRQAQLLGKYEVITIPNSQELDFESLAGRIRSSSYMPNAQDPEYPAVEAAIKNMFEKFQVSGKIKIEYETRVYVSDVI